MFETHLNIFKRYYRQQLQQQQQHRRWHLVVQGDGYVVALYGILLHNVVC